jgi:hypothetical protein
LKVVRLQFGIVPKEIVSVWIERQSLQDPAHGQPHSPNAWLAIHLVRIPRYAIEVLHVSYSDTFRRADARPAGVQNGILSNQCRAFGVVLALQPPLPKTSTMKTRDRSKWGAPDVLGSSTLAGAKGGSRDG